MAKTVGDVITEARSVLQDVDSASYRYSDADLYASLNTVFLTIKSVRPDAFIGTLRTFDPIYTFSDSSTPFPIDGQFFFSAVLFVAGFAELRDDEFAVDNRASTLLSQAQNRLTRVR